jgi:TrmH family RNA methyltransferase
MRQNEVCKSPMVGETAMRVRVVLLRPAEPMNVGAAARAMKNCAFEDLVLVAPRTEDWVTARRVAVHAEDLLASPKKVRTLAEAVGDCVWVVGTTSRAIPGRKSLSPRQVAEEAAMLSGRVAIVFGGEESGLSNDDLVRCHVISTIPAGLEQPSFNLAQAVLLYCYECSLALRSSPSSAAAESATSGRADEQELCAIENMLRDLLGRSGFAAPDRPRHGVLDLMQPLRRAGMTCAEARLWQAALRLILGRVLKQRPERGGGNTP